MEHNLNIYGIGFRYILSAICGVIGGLSYIHNPLLGIILLSLSVAFFLEGILAFDPLVAMFGKNKSKDAVDDFK